MNSLFENSTYVIAEAGINHNGDIEIAKKMISAASYCNVNAIKFQSIIPQELFSETLDPKLFHMSKTWILTKDEHIELQKFALKNKIDFFSTPFGKKSAKLLQEINVPIIKIASGELTNDNLISYVAKSKKPLLLSTGMSDISEIFHAVNIIKSLKCPMVLLHCISSYPTKHRDTNLATIPFLQKIFNVPIGFSDHTLGLDASLTAVSLGASVIEKHFTLDKNMDGPDQKLSLDPKEFSTLVKKIHKIKEMIGNVRTSPLESEQIFRKNMRKSLVAIKEIPKGKIITKSMMSLCRPGIGIPPNMMMHVLGRKTKKPVKKGTLLSWDDF